jgi:D-3-phosphoglycerate dehydrogenase
MAAETIREFMETGTIRNSVNFPATELPQVPDKTIRITVVNKNVPGALAQILEAFAKHKLNIVQQINQSRGDIAYNVLDIDPVIADGSSCSLNEVQKEITMLDGVLSSRVLFGTPGAGYARKIDGVYHV